jgi:hypothetical protein
MPNVIPKIENFEFIRKHRFAVQPKRSCYWICSKSINLSIMPRGEWNAAHAQERRGAGADRSDPPEHWGEHDVSRQQSQAGRPDSPRPAFHTISSDADHFSMSRFSSTGDSWFYKVHIYTTMSVLSLELGPPHPPLPQANPPEPKGGGMGSGTLAYVWGGGGVPIRTMERKLSTLHRVHIFIRDETGLAYLPTQLQLYWWW